MSKQRVAGTRFETALLDPLSVLWREIERTGSAAQGEGDFRHTEPLCIEAKAHKLIDLAGFVDQISTAAAKLGKLPALIIKRRRKSITDAYVVLPLWAFIALLQPLTTREEQPSDA